MSELLNGDTEDSSRTWDDKTKDLCSRAKICLLPGSELFYP